MHTITNTAKATRRAAARDRPAVSAPAAPTDTRVSRNPAMRVQTVTYPYGFTGTRRHGNKRSAKGGSSTGGCTSVWTTTSPSFATPGMTTHDSRWSQTVQSQNV